MNLLNPKTFMVYVLGGLSVFAVAGSAVAQTVVANDDVVEDTWVPNWLKDRPLGLTVGLDTPYEGAGDLVLTINMASDYGSAMDAGSSLQTMSSIDIPILDLNLFQLGISGNLLGAIESTGAREGLDPLGLSLAAGIWGSFGIDSMALDVKVISEVWAPETEINPREGIEAQLGVTLYSPMGKLGGGRDIDLAVRADVTFADDAYMNQFFGVSASEAASTGLAAHTAKAGFKSAGLSMGTAIPLSKNWEIQGGAGLVQLLDGAAASPWVTEQGELTDIWGNIGVAFRF